MLNSGSWCGSTNMKRGNDTSGRACRSLYHLSVSLGDTKILEILRATHIPGGAVGASRGPRNLLPWIERFGCDAS